MALQIPSAESSDDDVDDAVIDALIALEESAEALFEDVDAIAAGAVVKGWESPDPAQIEQYQHAKLVLLERMSSLKWVLMERQADADIRLGRTKSFASVEGLIAHLHKSVREAE